MTLNVQLLSLSRYWVVPLLLAMALSGSAATVIARGGTPNGVTYFGGPNNLSGLYVSWTQTATVNGPITFSGTFHCVGCTGSQTATATLYLTNSIGPGTTPANVLASGPFSVSATVPTVQSFTASLTLPPGTYYVILGGLSSNFAWDRDPTAVSTACTGDEQCGSGVTSNPDGNDTFVPPGAFQPADLWNVNSPARSLLFSVTNSTPIPALSDWMLAGTAALLLGAGLWLTRRRLAA